MVPSLPAFGTAEKPKSKKRVKAEAAAKWLIPIVFFSVHTVFRYCCPAAGDEFPDGSWDPSALFKIRSAGHGRRHGLAMNKTYLVT